MSSLELRFTTGMGWSARLRAKRARTSSCARLKEMRERAEKIKMQATICHKPGEPVGSFLAAV